jgi:hypothetical protein
MTYPVLDLSKPDCGWPETAATKPIGRCPVCGAHYKSFRTLAGHESQWHDHKTMPSTPYIAYECGGMYREVEPGFWSGRCRAVKRQQELKLTTEEA